jgi:hypothetical protein
MDPADLQAWFDTYIATFAALARGEHDEAERMLDFYAVPLLQTSPGGAVVRGTAAEVVDPLRPQFAALQADDYERSDTLQSRIEVLNDAAAIYTGEFSRIRRDGSEIARFWTTYWIADGEAGRRIFALALRSAAPSP